VNNHPAHSAFRPPKIWAIGSGKGGVGKSLVSILLSIELAHQNKKTILVDTDLGGANLHTLMGMKAPSRTLNDFITRKHDTLEKVCIQTSVKNLQLICGASEMLAFANPQYAQKKKIVQSLIRLPADHVILDLGAGASYNTLDLFLLADHPIVVVMPQPISIQNAYGFIRNAVYRKLSRMTARHASLQRLITDTAAQKNNDHLYTIPDLFAQIFKTDQIGVAEKLKGAIDRIKPIIVTNNVRNERDQNAGRIIQLAAEKYLAVGIQVLGAIRHDPAIEELVSTMVSLAELPSTSTACTDAAALVKTRLGLTQQ
jgi:flagellar biosynthesis protein FlhG